MTNSLKTKHATKSTQKNKQNQHPYSTALVSEMASEKSLYEHDVGFYYYMPGLGLPGKLISKGYSTWSRKAVDAAINVDLDDSDVLVATYPKTGKTCVWIITAHKRSLGKGNIFTSVCHSGHGGCVSQHAMM